MENRKPHFRQDGVRHATIDGHRFHLVDHGAEDILLFVNGQQPPLILDRVAADFMEALIDGMWRFQQGDGDESEQVIQYVVSTMRRKHAQTWRQRMHVSPNRIRTDLNRIFSTIMNVAEGHCPAAIGLEGREIRTATWGAPARMDAALTYDCNLACGKCYLNNNVQGTLSTAQWVDVFGKIWSYQIPQVVFTGGEPTLRSDLVELVDQADEFLTGLITNGTLLAPLAGPLAAASLDYVQVTIESHLSEVHNSLVLPHGSSNFDPHTQTVAGIRAAIAAGISTTTNTTLTQANAATFHETVKWLRTELGVCSIACNTLICSGKGTKCQEQSGLRPDELKATLERAIEVANKCGAVLSFYSPTCYSDFNPLELGLGIKQCSAACQNMTVQPDGTVIPCQSWNESVGNILTDPWPTIWNNPICSRLRNHELADEACGGCVYRNTCGGGCPLDKSPRTPTLEAK